MTFQHYIWDFDGTLFNSYPHMAWAFQTALKDYGLEISIEEIMPWLKLSVTKAVCHFEEQYTLEGLSKRYAAHEDEEDGGAPVRPYDGAEQVCREICAQGGFNYLYTHRGLSALTYLRRCGMDSFFRDAVTQVDGFPSKPAPDAIRHLCEKFRMDPETVLMLGDRDIDILAGTNAGVHGCLFDPDGYFRSFQVEYRVDGMPELAKTFLK